MPEGLTPEASQLLLVISLVVGALAAFWHRRTRNKLRDRLRDQTLELKQARGELARQTEIATHIPSLVQNMTEIHPQSALPSIVVRATGEFFRAACVGFFAPVEGSDDFTMLSGYGFPKKWENKVRLSSDEGLLGIALQKKTIITKNDPYVFNGWRAGSFSLEQAGFKPDFVAPIFGPSGALGVLMATGCTADIQKEKRFVSTIVDLTSTAYQLSALHESLRASHSEDALTGAANRTYFAQRFESMLRHARNYTHPLSLLFFDVDQFKQINDTYGHRTGDVVLKKIAQTARECTRSSDTVARYGGDEFVVLIVNSSKEQATTYAEHLREKISVMEVRVPGHENPIRTSISVGVSTFPEDGTSTDELTRAADIALYIAKKKGRNQVVLATPSWLESPDAKAVE